MTLLKNIMLVFIGHLNIAFFYETKKLFFAAVWNFKANIIVTMQSLLHNPNKMIQDHLHIFG